MLVSGKRNFLAFRVEGGKTRSGSIKKLYKWPNLNPLLVPWYIGGELLFSPSLLFHTPAFISFPSVCWLFTPNAFVCKIKCFLSIYASFIRTKLADTFFVTRRIL